MNFFYRTTLTFLICFISLNHIAAQLSITPNVRPQRVKPGQEIKFLVEQTNGGTVDYSIKYASGTGFSNLNAGSLSSVNNRVTIPFSTTVPGYYRCEAINGSNTAITMASVAPLSIEPTENEPSDFDAYWQNQKTALATVPLNTTLTTHSSTDYADIYNFSVDITDGKKAYGYLAVPKNLGSSKIPAIIELPAFGNGANVVNTDVTMAERGGVILVKLNIHNNVPTAAGPNNYIVTNITDANNYYLKYAIQGVIKTIDYLQTTRSNLDFNGQVGITGLSQGGGLAILAAGIDSRISLLMAMYPSHCEHNAAKYGKPSGFPNYYINQGNSAMATVQYYDAVYSAKRYSGPAWIMTAYNDILCYPATVTAAFNQLRGKKILQHEVNKEHSQGPEEFFDSSLPLSVYAFIRQHFPAAKPSWLYNQNTTAFDINAGNDVSNNISPSVPLSGTVTFNGITNTSFPVYWEKISGPGNVTFSNATSRTTSASFSQMGTYRLRFVAEDTTTLASDAKYFQIVDEVTITTNNAVIPIEWSSFEGQIVGQSNLLTWQILNEYQNNGFTIERSADAKTWQSIGYLDSKSNTKTKNDYAFTDETPLPTTYYRIVQTDVSGNQSYSKILNLKRETKPNDIKIYPNPMHDHVYITNTATTDIIEVYNLFGQVWLSKTGQDSFTPLSIAHLPNGIYLVSVKNQKGSFIERVVKQ